MSMVGGYMGRYLFVDLTRGEITEQKLDYSLARKFLGGYGLAAHLLYDKIPKGADPLGEGNVLGVLAGPLTGTSLPLVSRYTVAGKSPLTGLWGDANSRGFFGPLLKFSGYDGLFFFGRSPAPVYFLVGQGKAELHPAQDLWGQDTYATEDLLKARHGKKAEVSCIGPSGEKLSRIAGVITAKGKAAARSGLGALMGSKNLKAVVALGGMEVPVARPEALEALRLKYSKQIKDGYGFAPSYTTAGTPGYIEAGAGNGDSPVKNWYGVAVRDLGDISPYKYDNIARYIVKKGTCYKCVMGDWKHVMVENGPFALREPAHIPEYETASAFGSYCCNTNFESIIKCNDLCNRYGLDTISAGSAVAFAMSCFEKDIITEKDTDGIALTWGNSAAIVALVEKMGRREGIGELLADGVRSAAEKIGGGAEKYAIHVGGQELPAHDARFEPSMASIYLNDATPGRHGQASQYCVPPLLAELKKEVDFSFSFGNKRDVYTGRAEAQRILSNLNHCVNSLGMCLWGYLSTEVTFMPECYSAVTGWDVDLDELITTGERIGTMRLAFNIREGVSPAALKYPEIARGSPPLADGPTRGITVDLAKINEEYYKVMDWDPKTGKPSAQRLDSLGLGHLAKAMGR
jgi:aldehyde:ferredoxin oxidoreductase